MLRFKYSTDKKLAGKVSALAQKFEIHKKKVEKHAFVNLPREELNFREAEKFFDKFETIAVVGIGGSSLGAKSLASALNCERLIFIDNVDSDYVSRCISKIAAKKCLFLLISKSGETIEILSLANILLAIAPRNNFLVITDNPKSAIGKLAEKYGIPICVSPQNIPGRFSILSIVGLLAAALGGISTKDVLNGAKEASIKEAYRLACYQYAIFKAKKNIMVLFPYAEALTDFADWYVQLLAESIGKSKKIGITPVKAIGVKDQHSQLQLFLDGPEDKLIIFLKPEKFKNPIKIPGQKYDLDFLFNAEYEGVKNALKARKKPFVEISFPHLDAKTLGSLFYLFELEVAFLGSLFHINSENQPAVELSKKLTKKILNNTAFINKSLK